MDLIVVWWQKNLDILVSARFLNEKKETFETDQNIFGEIRRHTYSLTPDGDIIMEEIRKETEYMDWKQKLDQLKRPTVGERF